MKKLLIIGAGGHGKVVAECAAKNNYEEIVFLDDDRKRTFCGKYTVAGKTDRVQELAGDVIVAIGSPQVRQMIQRDIEQERLITLIHPDAVIADDVVIGRGSVIMAGVVVNPGTVLGDGCIVNTASSVDHDCHIGDFVHIAAGSHIAGTVNIGSRSWIGAGSIISNNVDICSDCVTGAGTVVVKNINEPGIYMGIPSKKK